jgi:uncharacterized metal-binding protein YceD (DUF177 family)
MPATRPTATKFAVSELRNTGATQFLLEPNAEARQALARELAIESVKKLRFVGEITPKGKKGWKVLGKLGATVVQSCIVTLEPVSTRIDTEVLRHFVPECELEEIESGSETEVPEDDSTEVLEDVINLENVMAEALSLALPTYPRKEGADLGSAQFSEDGVAPMQDEELKPFAGLAGLREKMLKDGEDE